MRQCTPPATPKSAPHTWCSPARIPKITRTGSDSCNNGRRNCNKERYHPPTPHHHVHLRFNAGIHRSGVLEAVGNSEGLETTPLSVRSINI